MRGRGPAPCVSTGRSIHAAQSITPSPREGIEDRPRPRVRTRSNRAGGGPTRGLPGRGGGRIDARARRMGVGRSGERADGGWLRPGHRAVRRRQPRPVGGKARTRWRRASAIRVRLDRRDVAIAPWRRDPLVALVVAAHPATSTRPSGSRRATSRPDSLRRMWSNSKAEDLGATEIAKRLKVGRASVYRVLAS